MASIRKIGKKYLAEVRIKTFYKAKRFDSKLDAQSWAIEIERQRGKHSNTPIIKTVGDALDRFAKEISPTHKGARWEQVRVEKLKRDALADVLLSDLTTQDLQDWIDRQATSGATVRREFNVIQSTLTIARKKWKWIEREPQRDVSLPRPNPSRDRILQPGELDKILIALNYVGGPINAIRHQIAVAVLFALETAMRQGEIWGMEWERVHLDRQYVMLPDTKNGTRRDVPLSTKAVKLLKSMPKPHAGYVFSIPQASAGVIFKRSCELAGIQDLHFHDLRHQAITNLARKLTMLELARVVGHRDPRSLLIYYNETATELSKKLD